MSWWHKNRTQMQTNQKCKQQKAGNKRPAKENIKDTKTLQKWYIDQKNTKKHEDRRTGTLKETGSNIISNQNRKKHGWLEKKKNEFSNLLNGNYNWSVLQRHWLICSRCHLSFLSFLSDETVTTVMREGRVVRQKQGNSEGGREEEAGGKWQLNGSSNLHFW